MPGLIVVTNERNKKECYWLGCNPVMPGLIVVTIGTRAIGTRAIGCNPVMPGLIVVTLKISKNQIKTVCKKSTFYRVFFHGVTKSL